MDLIIYHNSCPDGWCAAFICKLKYPEADLMPLDHNPPPAALDALFEYAAGKDIIMVDYSLRTRELNDRLNSAAKSFRILDHHKTAQAVLEGASYATFDMKRSGAGLAWDYLFGADSNYHNEVNAYNPSYLQMPPMTRPWWVNYTEDQDLWNWLLPHSEEINAYLMVQPRTMDAWTEMFKDAEFGEKEVAKRGVGVRQYIEYYTRSVVAERQDGVLVFEGRNLHTSVINIPYAGVSEAGSALVKLGYNIGLAWFERGDGVTQFSLRSVKGGDVDVSAIAKSYGGGGHQSAAGFQLDTAKGRALVDLILGRGEYVPTSRCC